MFAAHVNRDGVAARPGDRREERPRANDQHRRQCVGKKVRRQGECRTEPKRTASNGLAGQPYAAGVPQHGVGNHATSETADDHREQRQHREHTGLADGHAARFLKVSGKPTREKHVPCRAEELLAADAPHSRAREKLEPGRRRCGRARVAVRSRHGRGRGLHRTRCRPLMFDELPFRRVYRAMLLRDIAEPLPKPRSPEQSREAVEREHPAPADGHHQPARESGSRRAAHGHETGERASGKGPAGVGKPLRDDTRADGKQTGLGKSFRNPRNDQHEETSRRHRHGGQGPCHRKRRQRRSRAEPLPNPRAGNLKHRVRNEEGAHQPA